MFANSKLRSLIEKFPQTDYDDIPTPELVQQLFSVDGDDYYCIKEGFCFQNLENVVARNIDLTNLEWDGNEIFVSYEEVRQVLQEALKIMKHLAIQLKREFPQIAFDLFMSLDIADPNLPPSATIRFYKVRDSRHIITIDGIDDYLQPVGIYQLSGVMTNNA